MQQETKYPWHKAPEFATCAATNADGSRYWHQAIPVIDGEGWWSHGASLSFGLMVFREPDINWRDSLEMRPKTSVRNVTIPEETAEFIAGLVRGEVDNLQYSVRLMDHVKVLDAAIQAAKLPSHGGPVCAYRCMGGPWDGRLVARRLGCTKFSVHVTDHALIHAPDNERYPVSHFFEYQLHQEGGSIWWQCGGLS